MENCFAEAANGQCLILTDKKCEGCPFYKSKQEFLADRLKSLDRIRGLPPESFNSIVNTYYGGNLSEEYESLLKAIAENEQETYKLERLEKRLEAVK